MSLIGALTLASLSEVVRAEEPAAPAAGAPAEAPKKKVKKDADYISWAKVAAASEACEQPILAYVEIKGDKAGSKIRLATVGNPIFKEFVKDNCLYYHLGIPQEEVRVPRGQPRPKNPIPTPNFAAVKASEAAAISKLTAGKGTTFPLFAVLSPGGSRVLGVVTMSADDASFTKFVDELKPIFEQGKCEFVISKKVQKVLDEEAKKRAALEKRQKK